jgi:hypothetical protein
MFVPIDHIALIARAQWYMCHRTLEFETNVDILSNALFIEIEIIFYPSTKIYFLLISIEPAIVPSAKEILSNVNASLFAINEIKNIFRAISAK